MAERFVRRKILPFAKQLVQDIKQDDLSGLAAELAYRFFLSLFPFFLFVAALGGFAADLFDTDNPTDGIIDLLGESVPQDVASVLRTQVDAVIEARNVGLISIGILGALWTASSGIGTLIKGLNRIHAVKEQRPFWKRFAVSIGLTLLAGGSLIVAFLVLIIGHVYGLKIANEIGMEGLAAQLFTLSRWPLVIVAVLTAVAFLYWAAPNAKLPFRWLTAGSALFTSAWLLLHYLFGVYLASAPITRPTGRSAASSSSSFGSTSRASCSSSALRSTHSSTLQESGPSAVHRQRRSAPEPRPARPDGWPL